jgi:RNA polymerase sigma-70 factor (ECF subfamily)
MDDLDRYLPDIVAGDTTAFGRWVAGAEPRLRASLSSVAGQLDAEAMLQECLLRIWQVAPRFVPDGRPDGLVRLAIRIARNLSISELRRRRVVPALAIETLPEPIDPGTSAAVPDPLLRRVIAMCREKLPSKPAAALAARLEGAWHPDGELARGLGMKLNTFLQNVGRARKLLAQCLRNHGVDVEGELT